MTAPHDNLVRFERSAAYWMSRARRHHTNAEHTSAGLLYRQAYEQVHRQDIALKMAENYYQMGCYYAARRTALNLLTNTPDLPEAYYWLGVAALQEGDEDLGERALAMALQKGRDLPLADDAQDLLCDYPWTEPGVYRRSCRAETLYERALDCIEARSSLHAEVLLRRAIRRGVCPQAEALLGELLLFRHAPHQAARYLTRASLRLPEQVSVWALLAQALYADHRPQEAQRALDQCLVLAHTAQEWSVVGAAARILNAPDQALTALQARLRDEPESNDLLLVMAAMQLNAGHTGPAIRCLNAILSRDPDDRDARAAWATIPYGIMPPCRFYEDRALIERLLADPPRTGPRDFIRLAHGLTVSLGGAVTYAEVTQHIRPLWDRLPPLQRRLCDWQALWPNAFYRLILSDCGIDDLPRNAALWPVRHGLRRIRRMKRFLNRLRKDPT